MARGGKREGAGRKKQKLDSSSSVSDVVAAIPNDALEQVLRKLPANVTAHELLNAVIRSPAVPGPIRMHAAAKVLPYEVAKPVVQRTEGAPEVSTHDGARDKLRNKLDRLSGPQPEGGAASKPH